MKRAIYVGPPGGRHNLNYGVTGNAYAGLTCTYFTPDSDHPFVVPAQLPRTNLYIPSEDQRRHCPKPISACTL